jgi:hypothetical protein
MNDRALRALERAALLGTPGWQAALTAALDELPEELRRQDRLTLPAEIRLGGKSRRGRGHRPSAASQVRVSRARLADDG